MSTLTYALIVCIATGAVFTSLCAALAIPIAAWLGVRAIAPAIRQMRGDWRAQAALAALAACTPGALFLFLVAYGLATAASSPCLQTQPGRLLFSVLAALMLLAIARAMLRARRRNGEAMRAVARSLPAPARLRRLAAQAGVTAYLLDEDAQSVVMLYRHNDAAVYVSTRALRDLGDRELLAALHHERAHQTRGDDRIAPVLYFLTDLLPLPLGDLVRVYRHSREFCADECAVQQVPAADLAAALLQMVVSQRAPAHAAALADGGVVHERLRALLLRDAPEPNPVRRAVVTSTLCAIIALGVAAPQVAAFVLHCSRMVPPS